MITVRVKSGSSHGVLTIGGKTYSCWIGKEGLVSATEKREGDSKTPIGRFALRGVWVRGDKVNIDSHLPVTITSRDDGWCDDVNDVVNYNRPVKLPYTFSHENMWRDDDDYYDIVIDIDYNRSPVSIDAGSAIFMHIKEGATAGCVAVSKADILEILPQLTVETMIDIGDA